MKHALASLVVLLAFLAGGCGGDDETVTFLVQGDPEELRAYRDLVDAFEETDSGVAVELIEAADRNELLTRLATSLAAGEPPDLFLLNYRFVGQFASKGALERLDERLGSSDVFREEDFYPGPLSSFRWGDELQCLPQNAASLVVYYNRDVFRRFGVPEPEPGWAWDTFVRTAQLLTRDANGQVAASAEPELGGARPAIHGLGVEAALIRVAPFVWANGGELVDDESRPTRLTLDEPASLDALRRFLGLRASGVTPTEEEVEAEDDVSRFANGRLAMLLDSRRVTPTFRVIDDFEWDVAPLPALARPASILHSDGYCMTADSEQKDAAWEFMEFALGPEGQRIVARTGRTVPSLREVAESDAFLDPTAPPRNSRVFLDAIPVARALPEISTWPEIEDKSNGIIENGMYLGIPAEKVAAQLAEQTASEFARGEVP